jgi:ribonuclease-3
MQSEQALLSDLERGLGHVFRDKDLLVRALTHASAQKKGGDNERLEFLGDRVLGLAVAGMLYAAFPGEDEGHLARRHTALVQKSALARVAERLSLGLYIRLSSGEARAGGVRKDTILSDTIEAVLGAIHLDAGYAAAEAIVRTFWEPLLNAYAIPPQDPKTALQEWAQAHGLPIPEYRAVSKSGPEHAPVFEIELRVSHFDPVRARASSKRAAEKVAAHALLLQIGDGEAG